jgi:hypothetical protein
MWSGRALPAADFPLERPLLGGGASGSSGGSTGDASGAGGPANAQTSLEISSNKSGGGSDGSHPEKTSPSQPANKSGVASDSRAPAGKQSVAPVPPATPPTPAAPTPRAGKDAKKEEVANIITPNLQATTLKETRLAQESVAPAGKPSPAPEAIDPAKPVEDKPKDFSVATLEPDRRPDHLAETVREVKATHAAAAEPAAAEPAAAGEPSAPSQVFATLARDPAPPVAAPRALPAIVSPSRTVRMRFTPWQQRMLTDRIVPTEPVPVSRKASVGALRDRLRIAQDEALPLVLRGPQFQGGVMLELPAAESAGLHWRDAQGATPPEASVQDGRAEVRWSSTLPSPGSHYFLCRADGSAVAILRTGADAEGWTLQTVEGLRAQPWLAFRHGGEGARFAWRAGAGAPLGPAWTESPERAASVRVGVSLETLTGGVLPQSLAVLDRETGWALVGGVEFALESRPSAEIARGR